MSIYRDFIWCPEYANLEILQRFYGAPSMSIYRDFMVPRVCQFTEILLRSHGAKSMSIYGDFMVPRVCQFTKILHDQAKHVKSLLLVNLQTFLGDFGKSVNYESYPLIQAATIYRHFSNILK